jgi:succinate dehydrogenase / fumarate reductase cytochrome b subunit
MGLMQKKVEGENMTAAKPLDRAFVWRRMHSLFGLWIVIFLMEHLLTNSQAALLIGENGEGFIRAVNFIKNLPYLHVIEIVLLGVPILMHMIWGIRIMMSAKGNSSGSNGSKPALKYGRNRAYSWQRITSWILLLGIIAHVGYMRFYLYPKDVELGTKDAYFVRLNMDPGLYTVADRLEVKLYNQKAIDLFKDQVETHEEHMERTLEHGERVQRSDDRSYHYTENVAQIMSQFQNMEDRTAYLDGLEYRSIEPGQVIAETSSFGTATLLTVRDSFKSPLKCVLYTIFVLAAVFHGFNGLWTFLITWGIVIKMRSQSLAVNYCYGAMLVLLFLGLASVWGTYFINLKN